MTIIFKNKSNLTTKVNTEGSVLIIGLFILALSTITGVVIARMTITELRMSSNISRYKMAFYAAESARSYVEQRPELYGANNMSSTTPKRFESPPGLLGPEESFDGSVQYIGKDEPPRGSGFEVGTFKAYKYKMVCNGYGPGGAESHIEAGFFRVGY